MSPEEFTQLESLILADDRDTERECQALLHGAQRFLFPDAVKSFEVVSLEDRSFYGSSDYIISANAFADLGRVVRKISIWELKSPQTIIMEKDDNNNRYRPTKALVKAENQLIHYQHEAFLNGGLHRRFDVLPENIVPGGIVIGRSDKLCSPGSDAAKAQHSLNIRMAGLYRHAGIRLLTWSAILDVFRR